MVLTHQKGRGSKIHLLLDGEYAATTDSNFWADNYIADGTDIDDEQWLELLTGINYKKALNKCADFLSRREHSVKELKMKLLRTVDEESADKAIQRYIDAGYLDDRHFCESLAEYLLVNKKYSAAHIRQECRSRGVESAVVDEVLTELEIDNIETITNLIVTKYSSKLQGENGFQKVVAALQRKGFSYGDIKSAFHRLEENEI